MAIDNPHRDRAVNLLQHYFRLVAQAAGNKWVGDHDAEVAVCVDEIIDAAALVSREERVVEAAIGLAAVRTPAPKAKSAPHPNSTRARGISHRRKR